MVRRKRRYERSEETVGLRVHMFSVNYAPEVAGIGPYVAELAEHLAETGSEVAVTTAVPHYPDWATAAEYADSNRYVTTEGGVTVERVSVTVAGRAGLVWRAIFEASYLFRAVGAALRTRPDVAVGYSPGLCSALLAVLAGRRARRTVIVVQDLLGKGVEQSNKGKHRFAAGAVQSLERFVARRADTLVVISEAFVPYFLEMGVDVNQIVVMPNWIRRTGEPCPQKIENFRATYCDGDELLVMHTGTLGAKQGLEQLVEAARVANERSLPIKFAIVGGGPERESLEALAAELPNISFSGFVASDDYASLLDAADVLVVCQAPSNVDMSFPSKIASYVDSTARIVAWVPVGGSVATHLEQTGAGVAVPSGDLDGLLAQLLAAQAAEPADRTSARTAWDAERLLQSWSDLILSNQRATPFHGDDAQPTSGEANTVPAA